jgi:hypothetical protein
MARTKHPLTDAQKEKIQAIFETLRNLGIPEDGQYAHLARLLEGTDKRRQNFRNWMTGERTPENPEIFDTILQALQGRTDLSRPLIPVGFRPFKMRFAGIVPCGDWGDPLESEEFIEVDSKFESPRAFAARVVGDSCYPALQPADITIWIADNNPPYGRIVLAQRKGDHGCTVKELAWDPARSRSALLPINATYAEPEDGEGWGVIARLVGVVRSIDGLERTWKQLEGLTPRHLI